MSRLESSLEGKLAEFARALIDQRRAEVVVAPQRPGTGHWFGGGNMIEGANGRLDLVGRYRNYGDSRTGLGAGERGLELAVFQSDDHGRSFEKVLAFSKADLSRDHGEVLSIEGSALHATQQGVELFVSTERAGRSYPDGFQQFLKPGAGIWVIDRLRADTIEQLKSAPIEPLLRCQDPRFVHVKDPVAYDAPGGATMLMFCTHPFSWSSSNTAYAVRGPGDSCFGEPCFDFFPRGTSWDVAMTRGTSILDVPRIGAFRDHQVSLLFYDGGESLRNLDEHKSAVPRPRGYSCEEIGGVAYFLDGNIDPLFRLSEFLPMFISPHGTGCSRYVDVLTTADGFFATWQQSQPDLSQPLVMHRLSHTEVASILAAE